MKLLHIIGSVIPESGGPIEGILRQHAVTKGRIQQEIVCCDAPDAHRLEGFPVRVHALGVARTRTFNPVERFLDHYRHTPHFIPWLRDNVRRYDAVIVNGVWNFSSFAASRVLPAAGVPYFVFTHGQLDPWFQRAYPFKDIAKQLFWWFVDGPLLAKAEAVLFTCEEERRLVRNRYHGHQGYREKVVGFGVTEPPPATQEQIGAFRALLPALGEKRFLLFLGRIHLKKGCDLLVDAFARIAPSHPGLDLVIAGPDQTGWRSALQRRTEHLGVTARVHWPGMLSGDAKWGAFRAAEAFILPSHSENFGIVVAEAMACGAPVLITNKVNIWREVDASAGGLVQSDDLDGTIRLMNRWLALLPQEQAKMRAAARAGFERHFRMEAAAENLIELVKEAALRGQRQLA